MQRCGRICLQRLLLGLIGVAVFTRPPAHAATSREMCGTERWAVKTLADPAAHTVDFHPRKTTVSALRRVSPTHSYSRARGVERTTYRIKVRLVKTKLEEDEDFHLVVADPRHPGRTMIVEFPSPNCTHRSLKRAEMRGARSDFVRACGQPSPNYFRRLHGTAVVTGVGFFDTDHGQSGVAPNAIELHPVLGFAKAAC